MRKKKINSRTKGQVGEREFVAFLEERGIAAQRSQQYCGNSGEAADVLCKMLPWAHFEIKRTEKFRLYEALQQATNEKKEGQYAVVAHRQNSSRYLKKDWVIVMDADEFFKLIGFKLNEPRGFHATDAGEVPGVDGGGGTG